MTDMFGKKHYTEENRKTDLQNDYTSHRDFTADTEIPYRTDAHSMLEYA